MKLFILVLLALIPACDLFGAVKCNKDADCPDGIKFCVNSVCSATADDPAKGHGINGDGTCTADAECGPGLCYDVQDASGFSGKCVPTVDDDASCAEAATLGADRNTGAPVIFSAAATRVAGDCTPGAENLQITLKLFDREGDINATFASIFGGVPGSSGFNANGSVATDGTTGDGDFFTSACVADTVDHIAIRFGDTSPTSNPLCIVLPAAGP